MGSSARIEDEDPFRDTDLRRGQPDAGGVVHRLDHVLGKLVQGVVERVDRLGDGTEHRITECANGKDRHWSLLAWQVSGWKVSPMRWSQMSTTPVGRRRYAPERLAP